MSESLTRLRNIIGLVIMPDETRRQVGDALVEVMNERDVSANRAKIVAASLRKLADTLEDIDALKRNA